MSELSDLCKSKGVRIETECLRMVPEDSREMSDWRVSLFYGTHALHDIEFHQGSAHRKAPSAADVLYCLCADASALDEGFEDWCSNFGYDTDSRKALDTFLACQSVGRKVRTFLGADFETFRNAEH